MPVSPTVSSKSLVGALNKDEPPTPTAAAPENTKNSIMLGLLVGFFIQFSTVGVHTWVVHNHSLVGLDDKWNALLVSSILSWLIIAGTAGVLLALLRPVQDALLHPHFISATIIGLLIGWNAMDLYAGKDVTLIKTIVMVGISFVWCKAMRTAGLVPPCGTNTSDKTQSIER